MARLLLLVSILLAFAQNLCADEWEQLTKRIYAHLTIKDYSSACQEAFKGRQLFPNAKPVWEASLKAEAKACHEKEMLNLWSQLIKKFPEEQSNRELLEAMAWCIVDHGFQSPVPMIRAVSTLSAFLSHDSKGVNTLLNALKDNSSFIRGLAVQLASEMGDPILRESLLSIFREESVWKVRIAAILAMGALKIEEAKPYLLNYISNDSSHHEERLAAIESIVSMTDKIERQNIQLLVSSNRSGFRLLACELIAHFGAKEHQDLLLNLLKDNCGEVRATALQVIGLLGEKQICDQNVAALAEGFIDNRDPYVAIVAAWLLTLHQPEKGQKAFQPLFKHTNQRVRLVSAAALAATGRYGKPLIVELFHTSSDPFVRMNLALGLIGQQCEALAACESLYEGLKNEKEKWMWEEQGLFKILAPSDLRFDDLIPNNPEAQNQLVRLDILNVLAIMQYPQAQHAIKTFLQKQTWGITGIASALLLTEGDQTALDLVEGLLTDRDKKVRVQAALILSMWGRGEAVIQLLQNEYAGADREMKERILEGLAKVGAASSLPFLVERLREPHQSLRVLGAAALLISLYH